MRHLLLIAILSCLFSGNGHAETLKPIYVDLELVLAVDVSGSVDWQEAALQRNGYVQALRSRELISAVKSGVLGKIAITYVEWAGDEIQSTVLDWAVVKDEKSALAFSQALDKAPIDSGPWTSIGSLIHYALPLIRQNRFQGTRRVIDISGDGPNNTGPLVLEARQLAINKGITINGLPIINDRLQPSGRRQIANLDKYYAACVIGGPGAFLVVANNFKDFARAIRRKLVFEIAGLKPPDWRPSVADSGLLQPVRAVFTPGCDIGERRLRRRWQNYNEDF